MEISAKLRWPGRSWVAPALGLAFATLAPFAGPAESHAQQQEPTAQRAAEDPADPRVGLRPGWTDAGTAIRNLVHVANVPRPDAFNPTANPGDIGFANTDLAFQGNLVFLGNFNGFMVYDISDPKAPRLRASFVCPGGQGDPSIYGNLLFISVEETRGRVDCGTQGVQDSVSTERFRGVRIFDISDLDNPKQVAAVQTCRGSHTHTLVTVPNDPDHVYVYVSGTSIARSGSELEGCSPLGPAEDPNTSYFRIEVIQVPLAAPHLARIVSEPRIFADETGNIAGLWPGGDHGPGTQTSAQTNQCHDITVYPEIGLAAGACSGNGILLDISDPVNPRRIDAVVDQNFAYWHSATFNNDGTRVVYTDEWGGGMAPRCRETDPMEWGANAIFDIVDRKLVFRGYYKMPAPQTMTENCVAHNGSLIPVPGRDIMVQGWYQGGLSIFDFTDPENPVEIAYFDRGPLSDTQLMLGGYWSVYWYNGYIYGSEITRGLDVFELTPSEYLSQNEIEAAKLVRFEEFNPQLQPRFVWPAHFTVARAYLDQLVRSRGADAERLAHLAAELDRAERMPAGEDRRQILTRAADLAREDAAKAEAEGRTLDARRLRAFADVAQELGS